MTTPSQMPSDPVKAKSLSDRLKATTLAWARQSGATGEVNREADASDDLQICWSFTLISRQQILFSTEKKETLPDARHEANRGRLAKAIEVALAEITRQMIAACGQQARAEEKPALQTAEPMMLDDGFADYDPSVTLRKQKKVSE